MLPNLRMINNLGRFWQNHGDDNLRKEHQLLIDNPYASADYGKAKMIAVIRGGHKIPLLKVETFMQASLMASCGT